MKKIFWKKHNNLTVLIAVSIISVLIPSGLSVVANEGGVSSKGTYSSGNYPSKNITYVSDNGTHHYVEPDSFNGSGAKLTISSGGSSVNVKLYETQEDVDIAIAKGACQNIPCATGASFGLEGPRETWAEQLKNAGNSAGGNGISFDFSDPVALAYATAALTLNGYDVSSMTKEEIEALATSIAKETGGFVSTELIQTTVVKNTTTGEYFYCPGDSQCDAAYAEGFVVTAITDALNIDKTKANTDDRGWLCEIGLCLDKDCPKGNCYDVPEPEVVEYNLTPEKCELVIPVIPKPTPKPIPSNTSSGGSCGSTASKTTYTTSTAGCGYIVMLTTETVTAQLPSAPSVVYAGKSFNWGSVSSVKNVSTIVWDTSELQYEMTIANLQKSAIDEAIGCIETNKIKLEKEYEEKIEVCNDNVEKAQNNCDSCNDTCKEIHQTNPDAACTCTGVCNSVGEQEKACSYLTEQRDIIMKYYEEQKKGYYEDLQLAEQKLEELKICSSDVANVGTRTESGTVRITNQKMGLSNGYVQIINTIKGVAKNSGMPLTAAEIAKIDTDTYLPVEGNFFIPYYVKNGTSGSLVGDIVGDISIPGYSCPINVTNYILCEEGDCETPSNLNIIYRPISLTNPFPNVKQNSSYRQMGSNWDAIYAELFITNNRGVPDYNIYNLTPVYTITLTPSTIKEIRNYNKQNGLNDFDMDCTNGYDCSSKFLWERFDGIVDTSNSCASSTGWDASCYDGGV